MRISCEVGSKSYHTVYWKLLRSRPVALSVASTVVLLRALEAQGLLESTDGHIGVGWLFDPRVLLDQPFRVLAVSASF